MRSRAGCRTLDGSTLAGCRLRRTSSPALLRPPSRHNGHETWTSSVAHSSSWTGETRFALKNYRWYIIDQQVKRGFQLGSTEYDNEESQRRLLVMLNKSGCRTVRWPLQYYSEVTSNFLI